MTDFTRGKWTNPDVKYVRLEDHEGEMAAMNARIRFLLQESAFIKDKRADSGVVTYQLWVCCDNTGLRCLHDQAHFFANINDAIDAAMRFDLPSMDLESGNEE